MESLSAFDTTEAWILNSLFVLSFLWVLFLLGSYTRESLLWYVTKDGPESERAPSPDHAGHVFGLGILAVVWIFAFIISSLHSSGVQGKYDFAQKLSADADVVGKPLHADVIQFIEAWPDIVESYRRSGGSDSFQPEFDAFYGATRYTFVDPKDYVAIQSFVKNCFASNANLKKLNEVLSVYPSSQEAFVDQWVRSSLRNDYSTAKRCHPEHVFVMTGISKHVYQYND